MGGAKTTPSSLIMITLYLIKAFLENIQFSYQLPRYDAGKLTVSPGQFGENISPFSCLFCESMALTSSLHFHK